MIRSEIDRSIDEALAFFAERQFPLPPYACWTPAQWAAAGPEYDEIRDVGLGWDVTDFGSGDLARTGRTIFTLRNGNSRCPKSYAQKAMCMPEGQMSITHYHKQKTEDIHNQGGGNVLISLWRATPGNGLSAEPLTISVCGVRREIAAGEPLRLRPGEWVCVQPFTCHRFGAEPGCGRVLSIEVSSVCDDHGDNIFLEPSGQRFPPIREDQPRRHVLCHEYPRAPGC